MLTPIQFKAATGSLDLNVLNALNNAMTKFGIISTLRQAHFLAQVLHESANLHFVRENLNYSATGLATTFRKYFLNESAAVPYARNQAKIANKVYANRMGNGPEASGDGFKYIGRGYIQITGKNNYQALSNGLGVDFVNNPQLLERADYAALSAAWFWSNNGLNALADRDDVVSITKRINGGINGLPDRKIKLARLKLIIR